MQPDANGSMPYLVVHLGQPGAPFWDSKWSATGNKVDTHFKAKVSVVYQVSRGLEGAGGHPLGDNTTPGPLNMNESVVNAVENGWAAFKSASPELVDMTITGGSSFSNDTWIMQTDFTIDFFTRTTAGNR